MDRYIWSRSGYFKCCSGLSGAGRGKFRFGEHWDDGRLSVKYRFGSGFYSALGLKPWRIRRRACHVSFQLRILRILFPIFISEKRGDVCLHSSFRICCGPKHCKRSLRSGNPRVHSKSVKRHRHDGIEQFYRFLWRERRSRYGNCAEARYDSHVFFHGNFPGDYAACQL